MASLALALDHIGPWFGALQWRYFGPRPLIEDNAVRSGATSTINGLSWLPDQWPQQDHAGRVQPGQPARLGRRLSVPLAPGRLARRLSSEDVHFHPVESRSFRVTLVSAF
ncbi:hypothetical protein LP420_29480 [Massilia sp. B-10]|nr:hypothetical protein LP420_29480 [Massilia sp. B-10]